MTWMGWTAISLIGIGALIVFLVSLDRYLQAKGAVNNPFGWLGETPVDPWWTERAGWKTDVEELVAWDEARYETVKVLEPHPHTL